jgi:hypothetical protein
MSAVIMLRIKLLLLCIPAFAAYTCNATVGCDVCDYCCNDFIPSAQCDLCVDNKCSAVTNSSSVCKPSVGCNVCDECCNEYLTAFGCSACVAAECPITVPSAELFGGACPVYSRTAMRWYLDEAAVAQRAFPGGIFSSFKVCELVSFMDHVIDGYSFIGLLYAFFLVIASYALAMTASVPMPDSLLGKIGFFLWTCCVVLSYFFVLMSLVSFVTANASASALYADCLAEGTTEYRLFNLVGIFSGAFHPFVLSCLCLMLMYMVLLFEAYRVWKARNGEDEIHGDSDDLFLLPMYIAGFH